MKRRLPHAFTLIEMVTVVTVIALLAGLVIGIAGYVQNKGAREKCLAQTKNIALHCEDYKIDNGTYPQNVDTDTIDPRVDMSPSSGASATKYQRSGRYLYSCLSGDFDPPAAPDNKPEATVYYAFKKDELSYVKDGGGGIKTINYIQDPFGNCYGYSTIGAKAEADYREKLRTNPDEGRPDTKKGYNPTFDFWSTGGGSASSSTSKWIKNWGE
jgi:prepilin-type N-terminal cleavage/methylation domain-containing protein